MRLIAAFALYALFFLACFLGTGDDRRNLRSFRSYPDGVQRMLGESGRFEVPGKAPRAATFAADTLLFTAVFVLMGLLLHEGDVWYFLALGEGLNLFDLLVVDLAWWQHSPRVRFEGIGEPEDYLGAGKHVGAFLRAIPVFAAAAILAALVTGMIL